MPHALARPIEGSAHLHAAAGSILIVLTLWGLITYDRREPFEYVSTEITPRIAQAGQSIIVHRHVRWHRRCEGEAWTEIVSVDRIVTAYDKGYRFPSELGDTYAERSISLPMAMRSGTTTYRGVIRFSACGLTSRLWPLEVPYQEATFEVR
jgi:hypothetical protein